MTENNLPFCCRGGEWLVRNSSRRQKEVMRHGYSSLPKIAVCSKCGRFELIDPGLPDEEFFRRKNARKMRMQQQNKEDRDSE